MTQQIVGTPIFNLIDEERKYLGFTAIEISLTCVLVFFGFIFNALLQTIGGCFAFVPLVRYVKHLLKISSFTRRIFYVMGDFMVWHKSEVHLFSKYYL